MKIIKALFRQENEIKHSIICFLVGLVIMASSVIAYNILYARIEPDSVLEKMSFLLIPMGFFIIGFALFFSSLNLDNKVVLLILVFSLWISLTSVFMDERIMMAAIILGVSITIFILSRVFWKEICTMITFGIIISLGCMVLLGATICFISKLNATLSLHTICYSVITICIIIYLLIGVRFNKLCLRLMGYSPEQIDQYNYSVLKNQLNIIYVIAFVILNLTWLYNKNDELALVANIINNALITGISITNVNWKSIFRNNKQSS